jgi:hypothetical protein
MLHLLACRLHLDRLCSGRTETSPRADEPTRRALPHDG